MRECDCPAENHEVDCPHAFSDAPVVMKSTMTSNVQRIRDLVKRLNAEMRDLVYFDFSVHVSVNSIEEKGPKGKKRKIVPILGVEMIGPL